MQAVENIPFNDLVFSYLKNVFGNSCQVTQFNYLCADF